MSNFTLVGGRASKMGIFFRILISSLDLSAKMIPLRGGEEGLPGDQEGSQHECHGQEASDDHRNDVNAYGLLFERLSRSWVGDRYRAVSDDALPLGGEKHTHTLSRLDQTKHAKPQREEDKSTQKQRCPHDSQKKRHSESEEYQQSTEKIPKVDPFFADIAALLGGRQGVQMASSVAGDTGWTSTSQPMTSASPWLLRIRRVTV